MSWKARDSRVPDGVSIDRLQFCFAWRAAPPHNSLDLARVVIHRVILVIPKGHMASLLLYPSLYLGNKTRRGAALTGKSNQYSNSIQLNGAAVTDV